MIGTKECEKCVFLLHYEWNQTTRRHDLPRCSIGFRDGNKVTRPCAERKTKLEKLRAELKAEEISYEEFKAKMLKDPAIKKEYEKLEPKYRKIRTKLEAKEIQ